jgi:hypothetical protein
MILAGPTDPDHIDWLEDVQSARSIKEAIQDHPEIKMVIGDHASLWDFDLDVETYTLPFWFVSEFYRHKFHLQEYEDSYPTECVFNFCINKKTIHRYLTLRAVEFFNLSSYRYSYSGSCANIGDGRILQEMHLADPAGQRFTKDLICQILGPVTIPCNFVGRDLAPDHMIADRGAVSDYGNNFFSWISGLDKIFQSSLVSLITESCTEDYDRVSVFTEKTFYSLLALTVPIWVGGFRNADQFKQMGFDIFEDVIDHSYQYEDAIFFRSFRAIEDNIDLLRLDLGQASDLRRDLLPRLRKNRDYLMSQQFLRWFQDRMQDWPSTVRCMVSEKYPIIGRDELTGS